MFDVYAIWKDPKNRGFLLLPGSIVTEHWLEVGKNTLQTSVHFLDHLSWPSFLTFLDQGYKIQLLSTRIVPEIYIDMQKIVYLKFARVCLPCLTTSSPVYMNYEQHSLSISRTQILNINSFSLRIILTKLYIGHFISKIFFKLVFI